MRPTYSPTRPSEQRMLPPIRYSVASTVVQPGSSGPPASRAAQAVSRRRPGRRRPPRRPGKTAPRRGTLENDNMASTRETGSRQQRELGRAGPRGAGAKRTSRGREADPVHHAAQEPMRLRQPQQAVEGLPRQQPEVGRRPARISRSLSSRIRAKEAARTQPLEQPVASGPPPAWSRRRRCLPSTVAAGPGSGRAGAASRNRG